MNIIFRRVFKAAYIITKPISGIAIHNSLRTRVIVISGKEILLIKTSFGTQKWSLPGGGVHKHENPEHAASRELHEETGMEVDCSQLKRIGELRLPKNNKWPVANIRFFATKLKDMPEPRVVRPLEIMEAKWFNLRELPDDRSATVDEGLGLLRR